MGGQKTWSQINFLDIVRMFEAESIPWYQHNMDGVDSASRLSIEQPARENCHISDELKSGKCILSGCLGLVKRVYCPPPQKKNSNYFTRRIVRKWGILLY